MNRIVSSIGIALIIWILVSDVGMVMKYYHKPNVYALMENISSLHYLILHKIGIQFAYAKVAISLFLLGAWSWRFLYPSRVLILKYATCIYSLLWVLIGILILSAIVGVLQYSVGLPIEPYNLSLLAYSLNSAELMKILSMTVALPLVLMALPRIYNRTLIKNT